MAPATDDTIRALEDLRREVETCGRCVLHETRTKSVFGEGDPGAELMFVGEAPGYHEDQQGRPFVGAAGKLLEELLASIGLTRQQVYIANVLKSRPPNNRDPRPEEIEACQPYLWRQIELIRPKVICTLGNFSTKLLSGDQTGITRVHGRPRQLNISGVDLYLYPIFHPAAALYTPAMLATLREDIARLPELLAHAGGAESAATPATRVVPAATSDDEQARDDGWRPLSSAHDAQPPSSRPATTGKPLLPKRPRPPSRGNSASSERPTRVACSPSPCARPPRRDDWLACSRACWRRLR